LPYFLALAIGEANIFISSRIGLNFTTTFDDIASHFDTQSERETAIDKPQSWLMMNT
jgi:hypothetical protein